MKSLADGSGSEKKDELNEFRGFASALLGSIVSVLFFVLHIGIANELVLPSDVE